MAATNQSNLFLPIDAGVDPSGIDHIEVTGVDPSDVDNIEISGVDVEILEPQVI